MKKAVVLLLFIMFSLFAGCINTVNTNGLSDENASESLDISVLPEKVGDEDKNPYANSAFVKAGARLGMAERFAKQPWSK